MSGTPPTIPVGTDPVADAAVFGDEPDEPGILLQGKLWIEDANGRKIPLQDTHTRVANAAYRIWSAKDDWVRKFVEQWKVNCARRQGIATARLRRSAVDDAVVYYAPKGATPDATPDVNQHAAICRKFRSVMFTDPPAPEVRPASGDDSDEDRAEIAKRILLDLQGPDRLRTIRLAEEAFDLASDFGSAFTHTYVNPRGGGRQPIEVQVHPLATHISTAIGPYGEVLDPATGLEVLADDEIVTRYVRPDGSLTTDKREAATRWVPALEKEVLTGRHVRPIPASAHSIDECHGVQIAALLPVRELRRLFPDLMEALTREEIAKLPDQLPDKGAEDLLQSGQELRYNEDDPEEKLVFVLRTYMRSDTPGYQDGLDLITIGRNWVAHRETWAYTTPDGERCPLPLPVAQYAQFSEGRNTFYKVGISEIIGGGNVARAAQITAWLEYLDKLNHPKILLPYSSALTAEQLHSRTNDILYFNPGGEPVFPRLPPFPTDAAEIYELLGRENERAAGLSGDVSSPKAQSARQAMTIISQAHAELSEPRQRIIDGYIRDCRIELELARAFLTVPQIARVTTGGTRHKIVRWYGTDLPTGLDIRIEPGTMTMMTEEAKLVYGEHLYALGLLPRDKLLDLYTTGLAARLGLADDEYRNRIRAQIFEFEEGPPRGWEERRALVLQQWQAEQAIATARNLGAPPIDLNTGLPPMPPPDPVIQKLWEPVPSDSLPAVAQVRLDALARAMQRPKYLTKPLEWRTALEMEYNRMLMVVQAAAATAQPRTDTASEMQDRQKQKADTVDRFVKEMTA